jgi:hypothetical protein
MQAPRLVAVEPSHAAAGQAVLLPRDRDRALAAGHRLVEFNGERLMQIDAALRRAVAAPRLALVEDLGEQIAEGRRVVALHADREVEPLEAERRRALRVRRRPGGVVPAAAVGVAQRFVRLRDLTELRGGHPIAGVDVRVKLSGEALVGPLDVGKRRAPFHSQDDVEIHRPLRSGN